MRRTETNFKKAMALRLRFSQSLASQRQRLSHAIVHSYDPTLGYLSRINLQFVMANLN